MRVRRSLSHALSVVSLAICALSLGVACSRTTDAPVAPPQPAVEDVTPPAPTPAPAGKAWLVWRQDVGGMGVTSLLEETPGGPDTHTTLSVNKALIVLAAGDAWALGPVTERWGLKPCGDDAVGVAKGLRYQKLGLAAAGDLPGDTTRHLWSTADKRPSTDESAIYDEALAFVAQVGNLVFVKHVTTAGSCPVPSEGVQTSVEFLVLDLATKTMADPLSLLAGDEKLAIEKDLKSQAITQLRKQRPDLAPNVIAEHLELNGMSVTRDAAGDLVVGYTFGGRAEAFRPDTAELGSPGPFELQATVVNKAVPRALREPTLAWPAVVASSLAVAEEADKARADAFADAGLYGGFGWTEVPVELVAAVRKALVELREAPTPPGPTDWD